MPSVDPKTRKACQNCTKAKAKCSPSENGLATCYRCQRLTKECVFEEVARKRGPKRRSRVKQLEQRVDILTDLLAANSQTNRGVPAVPGSNITSASPDGAIRSVETSHASTTSIAPVETPENRTADVEVSEMYDPIEAGVIDPRAAAVLLDEFKNSFTWSFPFVVIPASTSVDTLRRCQPLLFHAIMAVTTHATPSTQQILNAEFKKQIATRIIRQSHKSPGILQALLVYAAWYHCFYRPHNQQLAITLQLCVAMIQDLGLSKNPRDKIRKLTLTEEQCGLIFEADRSTAEKRAFLGTYYLTVAFAQAWRKRSTMFHTKYMAQCCQSLADHPEQPTDALIAPLIHLSELICRVSDYFSYDDIDNADVKGEAMLEMSTTNFRSELGRIAHDVPDSLKQNTTLNLKLTLLKIWIHEVSLHGSLWASSSHETVSTFPPFRYKMLYHTMTGIKTYLKSLIAPPNSALYHLAFPSWAGWFYANIAVCKLVFLQDNERQGWTDIHDIQGELSSLLPKHFEPRVPHEFHSLPKDGSSHFWNPSWAAKEAEVPDLFEKIIEKLKFTLPPDGNNCLAAKGDFDPLFSISCLQHSFLNGFIKKTREYMSSEGGSASDTRLTGLIDQPQAHSNTMSSAEYVRERIDAHPVPFVETMNLNMLNFDSIQPNALPVQQNPYDEWVWDLMMDGFTGPPL